MPDSPEAIAYRIVLVRRALHNPDLAPGGRALLLARLRKLRVALDAAV